jgi:hypothetical protein
MPGRIPNSTWAEIRTAHAAGIGLRELARNMGIPPGTVLARGAKREGWTQQVAAAKLIQRPELARDLAKPDAINAIAPMQSAVLSIAERGKRYVEGMARVSEKVLPHVEGMQPEAILDRSADIERFDKVARRNLGLNETPVEAPQLTLTINQLLSPYVTVSDSREIWRIGCR